MRTILAAVDFSEVSDEVIERAAALARVLPASITLIHVAAPDPDFVGFEAGPQSVRDSRARTLRSEHSDLQQLGEKLREAGLDATTSLVEGATVETILSKAQELDALMIVVGSHGRGALYRAFLGSVSEGVLRHSTVPVLVVPDRKRSAGP